eukprot:364235-Chlamydomonas_euryale.AAC.2
MTVSGRGTSPDMTVSGHGISPRMTVRGHAAVHPLPFPCPSFSTQVGYCMARPSRRGTFPPPSSPAPRKLTGFGMAKYKCRCAIAYFSLYYPPPLTKTDTLRHSKL